MDDSLIVGDLVQPDWINNGHDWDYFDILPTGYMTWNRGELGIVLHIRKQKKRRDTSVTVLHPQGIIIAFQYELRVIRRCIA